MLRVSRFACLFLLLLGGATLHFVTSAHADPGPDDLAQDRKVIGEVKERCEAIKNLTYLCDEIGPRLTGSKNLKRANEWAANKMKEYGLTNVHQEPWPMPEGWERGTATARLIEPDTGINIHIASAGWSGGTPGKIQANVVVVKANTAKDLEAYKGKLKGAVVLTRPPSKVQMTDELAQAANPPQPMGPREPGLLRPDGEGRAIQREINELLTTEGVSAILSDAGKPYDLLVTTGGWSTRERTSGTTRAARLFVSHQDYALLYRLASRPEPAHTRLELEVTNKFIPGPIVVNNTVGEIPGSDKPDEIVVVGAHLDSWDLAQGATDNGTGTVVVLEAARAMVRSGVKPKRTIRFILFTGEEQGLHGSAAYVAAHKEEMPKITAALVHDTGTGKVTGIDSRHRPALQPLLAAELVSLKELGVTSFDTPFIGGSDHASFDRAGVPGLCMRQEIAGYRLNHHSQLDVLERALEPNLAQGAQVMAVTALRLANRDALLPHGPSTGGRGFGQPMPPEEKKPEEKKPEEKKPEEKKPEEKKPEEKK